VESLLDEIRGPILNSFLRRKERDRREHFIWAVTGKKKKKGTCKVHEGKRASRRLKTKVKRLKTGQWETDARGREGVREEVGSRPYPLERSERKCEVPLGKSRRRGD